MEKLYSICVVFLLGGQCLLGPAFAEDSICSTQLQDKLYDSNQLVDERDRPLEEMISWPREIELNLRKTDSFSIFPIRDTEQQLIVKVSRSMSLNEGAKKIADFYRIPKRRVLEKLEENPYEEVSISSLLPDFFKKAGTRSFCGANCSNAAVRFHRRAILPIYMTSSGSLIRLRHFFTPVNLETGKLEFGDLLVVWKGEDPNGRTARPGHPGSLYHFAVYAGGDLVFQKEGPEGSYSFARFGPYGIQNQAGHAYRGLITAHRRR